MFKYFLTLLVALLSTPLAGQENFSVSGIIEGNDGYIPGATVQIEGLENGAVADANGNYLLESIPSGHYTLIFRSIGYKSVKKEIHIVDEDLQVNVKLEANSLGLDEVVVTATMTPTYLKNTPVKIEVINAEKINTFIPAAASSVVESIKLINGVQEVVACGVCFTNSISINGLPGPYTAILMDGSPIYGNLASVYGLNGIPNMIIDRFEVIKGPSSTLYGSEAVAGVINIITKDPKEQPLLSMDIMGTSHMESFGNIAVAPKLAKSSGFIGLNYAYINDFDDKNNDGFGDMINMDRYSLFSKFNIYQPKGNTFNMAAKLFYEDRRNGVKEYLEGRNYRQLRGNDSIYGESIYTKRAEVFGTYQLPFFQDLKVDFSLSTHFQDSYYGADYYEASQHIAFGNFIYQKQIADHQATVGLTTRYQGYDDNTVATSFVDEVGNTINQPDNQFIPGIFAQDEWSISSATSILVGARLDHYQAHGAIFSPRLNVKQKLGEWTTFRANFGTGFRIVNLFTEDHAFITGQREVEITESLNPERSYNAAFNLNHIYTLGEGQGSIDIDAYYTHFTNKIIPDYSNPSKIIYANSDGNAITKGLILNIMHDFYIPLAISLGGNLQEVTQTEPNDTGNPETRAIEFAPQWSGVFTANYQWKKAAINMAYTARITGPMALPEVYDLNSHGNPLSYSRPTRSTPFSFHNIQITKKFSPKFSVYAGVQNLFNHIQNYSPLVGYNDPNTSTGFSDYFDTAYAFSPIHGREFYVGVKWNPFNK